MRAHRLGATACSVTRLGLGLAALGRPGYINLGRREDLPGERTPQALAARAHDVLDAAWAAGVRTFDVARSYGRGEEFLGAWLHARRIGAGDVTVASKWGYSYRADWRVTAPQHEVKEHTLAILHQQWHESRQTLGPYLKLFQIHSATLDSGVLERVEVLRQLAHYKGDHVAIGLTLSGPGQADTLHRAVAIEVDGRRLFDAVQATWNVLEPSAGAALREAHDAGLGVIVKEALANGRLAPRAGAPDAPIAAALGAHARRLATTADALALAAALAQPWADVVLSGAVTAAQLRANAGALDVALDAAATRALAALAEPAAAYWATRAALPWH